MPDHNAWLTKAKSDLKMAKKGLYDDDDTIDCVVYHTHQCAEKALKGYLTFKNDQPAKTHDLEFLLKLCEKHNRLFHLLQNDTKILNPYSVNSRYPDDYFFVTRKEAEYATKLAKKILDFVLQQTEFSDQKILF